MKTKFVMETPSRYGIEMALNMPETPAVVRHRHTDKDTPDDDEENDDGGGDGGTMLLPKTPQQRERDSRKACIPGTPDYLAPELLLGIEHGTGSFVTLWMHR